MMNSILENIGRNENGYKVVAPADCKYMWNKFVNAMADNNTYCPAPVRVIYNVGTKAYPILDENGKRVKDKDGKYMFGEPVKVLTTVVFFDDNTKVSVTNSVNDGVKLITVPSVDGDNASPTVEVADDTSKEAGFVYAMLKRIMGCPDDNGNIFGDGMGRKLRDIVKASYDSAKEAAANKYKNKLAKDKYEASKGTAKPKRPSFAETVVDLRAAVDGMNKMIEVLKADLAAAKA